VKLSAESQLQDYYISLNLNHCSFKVTTKFITDIKETELRFIQLVMQLCELITFIDTISSSWTFFIVPQM